MSVFRGFIRQPIVHFMLLAALIFVAFALLEGDDGAVQKDVIVIDLETVRQLAAGHRNTWRRQPTTAELKSLIEDRVREEVMVREAEAFGLHENDAVIRRRLSQKMEFLIESVVATLQPSDEELEAFFEANVEDYIKAGRIAFEQVFVGTEADGTTIDTVKAALVSGTNPLEVGRQSLLPPTTPLATRTAIDGTFGSGFYATLAELPEATWVGPVQSGYGFHVVRIIEREDARIPELEEARESLEHDWRLEKTAELSDEEFRRMRSRYSVVMPDAAETLNFAQ